MAQRPLEGLRVLVTAEARIGERLGRALADQGALPIFAPCIRIEPPRDAHALRAAISGLGGFDWLVVTSQNGVDALTSTLGEVKVDVKTIEARVAAVGPATGRSLEEAGFEVDLIPSRATSASLLDAILTLGVGELRILLLQGDKADRLLVAGLERAGAKVLRVEAYRTVEGVEDAQRLLALLTPGGGIEAVTVMSGSAARALRAGAGDALFRSQRLVCIGPATAAEVSRLGAAPARVASPHSIAGLVEAVISLVKER